MGDYFKQRYYVFLAILNNRRWLAQTIVEQSRLSFVSPGSYMENHEP
jgi:hypothetical protein